MPDKEENSVSIESKFFSGKAVGTRGLVAFIIVAAMICGTFIALKP